MRHDLQMCCGTTANKLQNLRYVNDLERKVAALERAGDVLCERFNMVMPGIDHFTLDQVAVLDAIIKWKELRGETNAGA